MSDTLGHISKVLTTTATAEKLTASALQAKSIALQAGPTSQDIFIGGASVTAGTGIKMSAGGAPIVLHRDKSTGLIALDSIYFVGAFTGGQNCTLNVVYF